MTVLKISKKNLHYIFKHFIYIIEGLVHTCIVMGKAKRRNLTNKKSSLYMTRESAILKVRDLSKMSYIEKSQMENLITLFGLSIEELSESGVSYERLKNLESVCC